MRLRWPFLRLERNAVLCALLAYFINYNTLDAEFTYDDSRAILSNPDVLPSTPLSRLWKNDFWGTAINSSNSHGSYRPLSVLTFRFNYWLSEFRPWSYHFFNVVLHSISTYLVFTLGKSVLPSSTQTTATLLFAVHPVHCEAVASVVGRADILANVFFILSFLCYIEHVKLRNKIAGYVEVPTAAAATVKNGCIVKNGHRHDEIRVCHKYKFNNTECNSKVCRLESLLKKICQFLKLNIYLSEMEALSGYVVKSNFIKEWSLLAVSLVLATMAMLSKETGVTVLAVCAAYDLVKTRHLLQKNVKRKIRTFVGAKYRDGINVFLTSECFVQALSSEIIGPINEIVDNVCRIAFDPRVDLSQIIVNFAKTCRNRFPECKRSKRSEKPRPEYCERIYQTARQSNRNT